MKVRRKKTIKRAFMKRSKEQLIPKMKHEAKKIKNDNFTESNNEKYTI